MASYFIDAVNGDDAAVGSSQDEAWHSLAKLANLDLQPGDELHIAPGEYHESLWLKHSGRPDAAIAIYLSNGVYHFYPDNAEKRQYYISNCNGAPESAKALAIFFDQVSHVKLIGDESQIMIHGKMMEICVDRSEDILVAGLHFDYARPTVSEITITQADDQAVEFTIHSDSAYRVDNGRLIWEGEGWEIIAGDGCLGQEFDPQTDRLKRIKDPFVDLRFEELGPYQCRAVGDHPFIAGRTYQYRQGLRDYSAVLMNYSKDVVFRNLNFFFLHGMGLLCQFTENITLDHVAISPDPESGRTCAAWADCFHASGCRGHISVSHCLFDGAQDDAINIHGTFLQITEARSENELVVKFIHRQTYGLQAFMPGDEVAFVRWDSLQQFGINKVLEAELINEYEMLIKLTEAIPDWHEKDVLENLTWTPTVDINNCHVRHFPTRGFLVTTPREVFIEDNIIDRCWMAGIWLECDAQNWFESGAVKNVTIRGNRFIECRNAAIAIGPHLSKENDAVHEGIYIEENEIVVMKDQHAVKANGCCNLQIRHNKISGDYGDEKETILIENSRDVQIEDNHFA